MVLRPGATHYEPITWDDAFDLIASELSALDSPDEAAFYTSGRTSNEAGVPLPAVRPRSSAPTTCPTARTCATSRRASALTETIGIGKGTVTLDDVQEADLLVVVGQNPGTNHPRMLTALEKAEAQRCTIVAVNPLPEAGLIRFKNPQTPRGVLGRGTALADLFLQVRVNGDLALFKGHLKAMLGWSRATAARGRPRVHRGSHARLRRASRAHLPNSTGPKVAASGFPRARSRRRRRRRPSQRTIVCWAMGLTQHRNAVADDPRGRQLPAAARQHRPARRRASARCAATPTCRAIARWASGSEPP